MRSSSFCDWHNLCIYIVDKDLKFRSWLHAWHVLNCKCAELIQFDDVVTLFVRALALEEILKF